MNHYYTDEINTLILISLLKAHGIKKVIASPGTTNISFVGSIQFDPYFEIYSAVDERAAAFMACGLAEESNEPVVLTCTGATASRNYIPGLTEAYYRHLPVLAVTSTQHGGRIGNYVAQVIDRTEQFPDMVKKSYQIPTVHCEEDKQYTVTAINDAICKMDENGNLTEVVETKNIVKTADGAEADGVVVDVDSLVSMNMWGLTPDFLDVLEKGFKEFFEKEVPGNPLKAEYLIPIFIGELLEQCKMSVKVLKTNDTWYGMTYHEDVAAVKDNFKKMLADGIYKTDLFSDL